MIRPRTHFLEPLLAAHQSARRLVNARTGSVVAAEIELATDSKSRNRGLLGRTSLSPRAVMIIAPCNAIHTFFMRFTIDVVFANREGRVLKLYRAVPPWRVRVALGAFAVLELADGSIDRLGVQLGDRVVVEKSEDS